MSTHTHTHIYIYIRIKEKNKNDYINRFCTNGAYMNPKNTLNKLNIRNG